MVKKIFKVLFVLGITGFILGVVGWYTVRYISTQKASQKAAQIIATTNDSISQDSDEEQRLIAITKQVFNNFHHKDPATIPLYKVRPYITNKRLPEFIRLSDGVMETNIQHGLCDNASRMLAFILEQKGFSSVQLNMVTDWGGHSARLVTLSDGRKVFIDPFYGFIAIDKNNRLTNLDAVKRRIESGEKLEKTLLALGPESDYRFYRDIKNMYMSAEGQPLTIKAELPYIEGENLILGEIDGKEKDVKAAARKLKITPYWYYIGHKYNREWVRELTVQQPVKIVMTLVEPAEKGILIATPAPKVEKNILTWELDKGEELKLEDGLAQISLKRLNSYINVDQITIYPID